MTDLQHNTISGKELCMYLRPHPERKARNSKYILLDLDYLGQNQHYPRQQRRCPRTFQHQPPCQSHRLHSKSYALPTKRLITNPLFKYQCFMLYFILYSSELRVVHGRV